MGSINRGQSGFLARPSRPGDVLRASEVQELKDGIRRGRISVVAPLQAQDGPAGTSIWLGEVPGSKLAKAPAGGIPPVAGTTPGTAKGNLCDFDGTTYTPRTDQVDLYNATPVPVWGGAVLTARWVDGRWFVEPNSGQIALTGAYGIAPMSGLTPGSAIVTLYTFNGTTLALSSRTVRAYNTTATAVGGNKVIQLKYALGYFWVDVESC